jgi:sugar transferase (PEP-CTERM/EpsH1 system associated)
MVANQPPLVLHVIHHLVVGGMENGLVNIINRMSPDLYRHAIVCVEDYSGFRNRLSNKNIQVIALNRSKIGTWALRKEIFRICCDLKPSIVHTRNMSGLDAVVPARLAGVKYCLHGEHGWDVGDLEGKKLRPILLRKIHSFFIDGYITVSVHLRNYLIDKVGIKPSRILQIYNGVDTDKFFPRNDSAEAVFPAGFVFDDSVVIGSVGRVQAVKDQETLLRAFSNLVNEAPELRSRLRLVLIGDGPLLQQLRQLAIELGISELTWMPGARENIASILRAMDIFVLPSLMEGISNTILEAMATGLPIIATGVGGNLELVVENQTGKLFEPGNIDELSALLGEYVNNFPLRKTQGKNARALALAQFSLEAMTLKYQAVYQQALVRN